MSKELRRHLLDAEADAYTMRILASQDAISPYKLIFNAYVCGFESRALWDQPNPHLHRIIYKTDTKTGEKK